MIREAWFGAKIAWVKVVCQNAEPYSWTFKPRRPSNSRLRLVQLDSYLDRGLPGIHKKTSESGGANPRGIRGRQESGDRLANLLQIANQTRSKAWLCPQLLTASESGRANPGTERIRGQAGEP